MRPDLFFFASILSAGCASTSPNLEPRVRELELQVAELRGEVLAQGRIDAMAMRGHGGGSPCANVRPAVSIPDASQMTTAVAFDVGQTSIQGGDRVTITEVRGTRGDFLQR